MRIAAYRPRRSSGVAAQLDLVLQHILEALIVNGNQYEIRRLAADLETEATASDTEKYRRTPAMGGTASSDALPILSANNERTLFHAGNDCNARRLLCDHIRDTPYPG